MQAAIRQTDRVIQQYGDSIGLLSGCDIVVLTAQQEQQLRSLISSPNGGVVLAVDGTLSALPVPVPQPAPDQAVFDAAIAQLKNTLNTARTAGQLNNSVDALTVVLRRMYRELST